MKNDIINALELLPSALDNFGCDRIERLELRSLDNPGWWFCFDASMALFKEDIDWVKSDKSEDDWLFWRVRGNGFEFACSNRNLTEGFAIFFRHLGECINFKFEIAADGLILNLENWFSDSCNGDWEHSGGFKLEWKESGWQFDADFYDLNYDRTVDIKSSHRNSERDWFKYRLDGEHFYAYSSSGNLHKILCALFNYTGNF